MEISSRIAGTRLKEYRTVVRWRDTMNYAAAVGDENPRYFDDESAAGLIAPPMYAVAVTWPMIKNLPKYLLGENLPEEMLATHVHYTEHLEFLSPIKPGEELIVQGKIVAIIPHRAGVHLVIKFEARDVRGTRVFTEHIGGLLRGVKCTDGGKGQELLPKVPASKSVSAPVWEHVIKIDRLQTYLYDGCANIFFPIHTSKKIAKRSGLPGIILQGTATLALAARELINKNTGGDPLKLKSISCRFTGMVLPGTEIKVQLLDSVASSGGTDLFFSVLNQDGQLAISNGYARIRG